MNLYIVKALNKNLGKNDFRRIQQFKNNIRHTMNKRDILNVNKIKKIDSKHLNNLNNTINSKIKMRYNNIKKNIKAKNKVKINS